MDARQWGIFTARIAPAPGLVRLQARDARGFVVAVMDVVAGPAAEAAAVDVLYGWLRATFPLPEPGAPTLVCEDGGGTGATPRGRQRARPAMQLVQ